MQYQKFLSDLHKHKIGNLYTYVPNKLKEIYILIGYKDNTHAIMTNIEEYNPYEVAYFALEDFYKLLGNKNSLAEVLYL